MVVIKRVLFFNKWDRRDTREQQATGQGTLTLACGDALQLAGTLRAVHRCRGSLVRGGQVTQLSRLTFSSGH